MRIKAAGIELVHSEPGKPWQNGRIERFFGTLKEKLKLLPKVRDGPALDALLAEFCCWYNRIRPHLHLCGWTPAEAWDGLNPYRHKPKAVRNFSAWGGLAVRGIFEALKRSPPGQKAHGDEIDEVSRTALA